MASITVKGTYSLDLDTVRSLDAIARRWDVSKSEALRRAIRAAAASAGTVEEFDPLRSLDALQASVHLPVSGARRWESSARAERRASAQKRERSAK